MTLLARQMLWSLAFIVILVSGSAWADGSLYCQPGQTKCNGACYGPGETLPPECRPAPPITTPTEEVEIEHFFDGPAQNSRQSGIGLIHGWFCHARKVEVKIGRERYRVPYGGRRPDTYEACGDIHNGFSLVMNWNELGDGDHEIILIKDGIIVQRKTITVTTLGEDFITDAPDTIYCHDDFPSLGETVCVQWEESLQNFVIVPAEQ